MVKVVEERIYAPYGLGLHQQEVIEAGREYLRLIARKTFEELAANEVYSEAVPGQLVADISGLNQAMLAGCPLSRVWIF